MIAYLTTYQWLVEVEDGHGPVSITNSFATLPAPGSWWNDAWTYRKRITVDPTQVDEDLTNFTVLVDITDPDLAAYAQSNGDDIVFTDYNSIKVSHEIVSYDNVSGHLVAWVKASLSASEDTLLQMYFGNATAGNQEDVDGTWDNNFVMVQHLEETSGTHFDSTAFGNDGTTVVVTNQT